MAVAWERVCFPQPSRCSVGPNTGSPLLLLEGCVRSQCSAAVRGNLSPTAVCERAITQVDPACLANRTVGAKLGQGRGLGLSLRDSDQGALSSRVRRLSRSPLGPGGDLREQFLLYVLGEKLHLKVGQGNFPGVLPLLKTLF